MSSIRVWWSAAVRCALTVVLLLGASGCPQGPKIARKSKTVNCDDTIKPDPSTGGVDLQAAFLCEDDTVTWQAQPGHTFQVEFKAGSPFVGAKSKFSDQDPSGKVKQHYDYLEVYKYSITVDSKPTIDPQVVGGGNP